MEDIELIKILWDYMQMNHELKKADCILTLGSSDTHVAETASDLYLKGYADKIVFSGGLGKDTHKLWNETEAEKFSKIAIERGVPENKIYLEKESTNTGDNFRLSKKLIENEKLDVKSLIIVCKPYNEKRSYAAFKKMTPEYEGILYSENISCEEYYKREGNRWIDILVGDVQRMKVFVDIGWQIEMDIPEKVWKAYETLVERGYDKFVFKDEDYEAPRKRYEKLLKTMQDNRKE